MKTVRNWCLDEMEIMSKKRLRAIVLRQFLASSSSESDEEEEEEVGFLIIIWFRQVNFDVFTLNVIIPYR